MCVCMYDTSAYAHGCVVVACTSVKEKQETLNYTDSSIKKRNVAIKMKLVKNFQSWILYLRIFVYQDLIRIRFTLGNFW